MPKKASTSKAAKTIGSWNISWRGFFIAASVVLNIAFAIVFITMATTNKFDGMLMNEGLKRYCAKANDAKFDENNAQTQALRLFTCARDDAERPFHDALNNYLDLKGIDKTY